MFDYIKESMQSSKGTVNEPSFISIRRTINNNLDNILDRLRLSHSFVTPDNLLIKIIMGLALSRDMDDSALRRVSRDRTYALSQSLKLTSLSNYGSSFSGQVTPNGSEIIYVHNDPFTTKDWKSLSPVKFIYHNETNINYQLGVENNDNFIAFISINVHMLAFQFLSWLREKVNNGNTDNVQRFVMQYPITNSVKSYIDISAFNLHYYRLKGIPIKDDKRPNGYPVPNVASQLTKSNLKVIENILKHQYGTVDALKSTPVFFKISAADLIPRTNGIVTQQMSWFMTATMLPFIDYGLLTAINSNSSIDQTHMSTLIREINAVINRRAFSNTPSDIKSWVLDLLSDVLVNANQLK